MINGDEGGPAFPYHYDAGGPYPNYVSGKGMSLREWFMGRALPVAASQMAPFGSTGNPGSIVWKRDREKWARDLARLSSEIADALIRERSN